MTGLKIVVAVDKLSHLEELWKHRVGDENFEPWPFWTSQDSGDS
jgi:hypothetical protein